MTRPTLSRAAAQALAERRGARLQFSTPAPAPTPAEVSPAHLAVYEAVLSASEVATSAVDTIVADNARTLAAIEKAVQKREPRAWHFAVTYNPDGSIAEVVATPEK